MKAGWLSLVVLLIASGACAQDSGSLEIRGVVAELGLSAGVGAARITVYQFSINSERSVFATGTTDSQGHFEFHPDHPGNYYVEATKAGYFATHGGAGLAELTGALPETTGSLLTLGPDHRREYVRLALMRLSELKGRVLDENDKPLRGITIDALDAGSSAQQGVRASARTNQDGYFSIKTLPPAQYLVRVSASTLTPSLVTTKFSDADLDTVAQGVESLYWPGVRDAAAAGSVSLIPGTPVDLGNLRMRKGPVYRVRVSIRGCEPGEGLRFALIAAGSGIRPLQPDGSLGTSIPAALPVTLSTCDDFLVRDLLPGSYEFSFQSRRGWALVPAEIVNKNLVLTITLVPDVEISGTVVAAHDGIELSALGLFQVSLWVDGSPPFANPPRSMTSARGGRFSFKGLKWSRQILTVSGLMSGYYVKEIRSDGAVTPNGMVTAGSSSRVEIVIDDQPASLAGTVTEGEERVAQPKIYVSPSPPAITVATGPGGTGDAKGRFRIGDLPPGEYRVLAVPSGPIPDGASDWNISPRLWERAERVTLERGKVTEISLKLTDPISGN